MFSINNLRSLQKLVEIAPFIAIATLFFILNYHYIGPAYLADEIGYLTKAAGLAGYTIDRPSKWYAGYSMLLAPLFYVITDPMFLWKAIMLFNAVVWGINFYYLSKILLALFPDASRKAYCITMTLAVSYPAWALMSGYAFPTTLFSCLFTLGLYALINLKVGTKHLFILSICCGFLAWVHPLGYCVMATTAIAIVVTPNINKLKSISTFISITALMLLVYHQVIDVWLTEALTANHGLLTMQSRYYPGRTPEKFLNEFAKWEFWQRYGLAYLGQLSYTIIASFGATAIGAMYLWNAAKQNKLRPEFCYIVLTLLVVLGIAVLLFASGRRETNHYWIYGRYAEMVLLPLITVGFMSIKRVKTPTILLITLGVFIVGCLLNHSVDNGSATFSYVNVQSFWPFIFIGYGDFFYLFLIGAAGVLVAYFAFRYNHYALLGVVLIIYLFAYQRHADFHDNLLSERSERYPAFLNLVQENFNENNCVIFDYESRRSQKNYIRSIMWVIYTYYLYDYKYARATPEYWYNNCSGPIFTFDPDILRDKDDVIIVAWDKRTNLLLAVKKSDLASVRYTKVRENLPTNISFHADCEKGVCLIMNAKQLAQYTAVGKLHKDTLNSTERNGYLLLGPYISLNAGLYSLALDINVTLKSCVVIHIVSGNGKYTIHEGEYCPDDPPHIPFELHKDSHDVEVRLRVGSDDIISLRNYKIVKREQSGIEH